MKRIKVELPGHVYPVWIGNGILSRAADLMARAGFDSPPLVVSNRRVLKLHGDVLLSSLERTFGRVAVIRIPDGEEYKNHATLQRIYEGLFRTRADRHSWIAAFGGGVIGDVAGFAAATFLRGIRYVGIPTTLLAQVDSSVGGKVGINAPQGKNLIGAFHQPSAVLSDTAVLGTLAKREIASGLYEIIKCAAIRSTSLLSYLERRLDQVLDLEPAAVSHAVAEAVRIKAEVVARDEREGEERMILNFGHTVGHALETATAYRRFTHGEAVAWGMIAAAAISCARGNLTIEEGERLLSLIERVGRLPDLKGLASKDVWAALQRDKKFRSGDIRMVLLPGLGNTEIVRGLEPRYMRRFLSGFLSFGEG
jgi:3-dehydroquinate synthase